MGGAVWGEGQSAWFAGFPAVACCGAAVREWVRDAGQRDCSSMRRMGASARARRGSGMDT